MDGGTIAEIDKCLKLSDLTSYSWRNRGTRCLLVTRIVLIAAAAREKHARGWLIRFVCIVPPGAISHHVACLAALACYARVSRDKQQKCRVSRYGQCNSKIAVT